MSSLVAAWRRGQEGWPRRYVLVQFPNAPLLVALAAMVVAASSSGDVEAHAEAVQHAGMIAFAWWEMADGVNLFRRGLGTVVMVGQILALA